jgi:hypothetical protein
MLENTIIITLNCGVLQKLQTHTFPSQLNFCKSTDFSDRFENKCAYWLTPNMKHALIGRVSKVVDTHFSITAEFLINIDFPDAFGNKYGY